MIIQDDEKYLPAFLKLLSNLTKNQVKYLINLHNYVKNINNLSSDQIHTKYP